MRSEEIEEPIYHEMIKHKYAPRENQKIAINEGTANLLEFGFHGLFMTMGLGKTKTSLNIAEVLATLKVMKRILILCPKALTGVWKEEIPKHSNFSFDPVIWSSQKAKTMKFQREVSRLFTRNYPILIVNIEAFQTKNPVLAKLIESFIEEPTVLIMDESSKIKNIKAQRTLRIIEVTEKASYKMILTGTPVEESPLDIYSQFEFLRSNFWYKEGKPKRNFFLFQNRYAITKEIRMGEGRSFKKIVGFRRVEEIARKISPYVTKQSDANEWLDLPDKVYSTLHVEMNKEQREAYQEMKDNLILEHGDEVITAVNAVSLLTRLRQIAGGFLPESGEPLGTPPGITILLEDVSEYSGKVIIVAAYVAEIEGIEKALLKAYPREEVITYYGATKDRETAVKRFIEEGKFFIMNPSVGGMGLNLQCASLMYLYSRPYSYAQNVQGEARIHRSGQKKVCFYKDIVHIGTVQEKVLRAISKKQDFVTAFNNMTIREIF